MSNQTIQKFYNTAAKNDFARLFQFRVLEFANVNLGDALIYIETATLPGRAINNVTVPYMGLAFNVPGTASYPNSAGYSVTFRCDQEYKLRAVLEAATFNTFDDATSSGQYSTPGPGNILQMALLDKNFNYQRVYTLFGAYIISTGELGYDIKDTGSVASVNATVAYQFWRAGKTPQESRGLVSTQTSFRRNVQFNSR